MQSSHSFIGGIDRGVIHRVELDGANMSFKPDREYVLYTDGSAWKGDRNDPRMHGFQSQGRCPRFQNVNTAKLGGAGGAFYEKGKGVAGEIFNFYGYVGDFTSNNQSEFAAAGVGLEEFIAAGGRRIEVFTDSEFLCNALPEWLAPDPNHSRQRSASLQPEFMGLRRRIIECAKQLAYCRFSHVKAHAGDHGNTVADHFARLGSGIDCPHHANGPQQGCGYGTLGLVASDADLMAEFSTRYPNVYAIADVDDISIYGEPPDVAEAMEWWNAENLLRDEAPNLCKMVLSSGDPASLRHPAILALVAQAEAAAAASGIHNIQIVTPPSDGRKTLGVPIGPGPWIVKWLENKGDDIAKVLGVIDELGTHDHHLSRQCANLLIRECVKEKGVGYDAWLHAFFCRFPVVSCRS